MAIKKNVTDPVTGTVSTVPVPDFTYRSEPIARMIVDAWVDSNFRAALLERVGGTATVAAQNIARAALAERGIYLQSAVVISEDEYHADYVAQPNQIAFVLPDVSRVNPLPNQSLLQTAELLMATTPNGI